MRVAIIGCGAVGASWAAAFARVGHDVALFDASGETAERAQCSVLEICASRRPLSVNAYATLESALDGAGYVQESIEESVDAKTDLFIEMDAKASADAVLASSTSAIRPSDLFRDIAGRARCVVAHPFNPPHLIPLVEVAPSPWTDARVLNQTMRLLEGLGQAPILIRNEVAGFVGNRLQAAVVNEAMHLIHLGVIEPEDLDRCMTAGLGRRWALYGPLETMDLNARGGFADYATKFGESYHRLGCDLGVAEPWSTEATSKVVSWRRSKVPLEHIAEAQAARDLRLLRLSEWLGRATAPPLPAGG